MIDIVMASWNCVNKLIEAVTSVRRNTEGPWRMFVQDNDSEDGAAEWLAKQTDLHVTFNKENHGFSRATNQGVLYSLEHDDSYWTVLMNNDIIVPPRWDTIMINALSRDPRVKICSPILLKSRGRSKHNRQWRKAMLRYGRNAMHRVNPPDWIGFSCVFVHKDAWRECGLLRYDGDYWHWNSDKEFCRRIHAARPRWRIATYAGLGVSHWHSASRAYAHRRRAGERASNGIVWRIADEMYGEFKRINTKKLREMVREEQGTVPTAEETNRILYMWLEKRRAEKRKRQFGKPRAD